MFFCHLFKGKQILQLSGSGHSKLLKSLVNVSLNFQPFVKFSKVHISDMPVFLSKKFEKLLQCKSFSQFFNKKYQCIWI